MIKYRVINWDYKEEMNAEELKGVLLENEINFLKNNLHDYLSGELDFNAQIDHISRIYYESVESVIDDLKNCWGYSVEELGANYKIQMTFKPSTTLQQVEDILRDIKSIAEETYNINYFGLTDLKYEFKGFKQGFNVDIDIKILRSDFKNLNNDLLIHENVLSVQSICTSGDE